jgi:hypothetical protein
MNDLPEELAARLKAEGDAALAFFQKLQPEQWRQVVYPEGGPWQVQDLLAHFIAAEQGFQQLLHHVAEGGSGIGADFNVDEYNAATVRALRNLEPTVLMGQFAMVRERTVALVSGLTVDQLGQIGRHPGIGQASLGNMIRVIYHHNNLHLRDARSALKAPGAGHSFNTGVIG